jgi:hypothetical protein
MKTWSFSTVFKENVMRESGPFLESMICFVLERVDDFTLHLHSLLHYLAFHSRLTYGP